MSDVVLMAVQESVAVLTLNRPDRLNAWTPELQTRYFDRLDECAAREDVRVIVVTGAGRGFCAGADMAELQSISGAATAGGNGSPPARDAGTAAGAAGHGTDDRPVRYPLSIPKPVIAAINGPCAGIGLVFALMCDIRFVDEGAKITASFSRRGLIAEHGISWILPRLIGPARALDLLFSSRVILGIEAVEMGLANRAVPATRALEETVAYAQELARECSPASMAAMKRQIYTDLERSLADAVETANQLMGESFTKPDFAEGVQSFLERRTPSFAPLAG